MAWRVAAAGEPLGVTFNVTTATRLGLHIYEYSGLQGPAYRGNGLNSGSGTSLTSGTVTTTSNDELVITGFTINALTSFGSWTNSFAERSDFPNGGSSSQSTYAGADRVAATPGSYLTSATTTVAGPWIAITARFASTAAISGTVFEDVNYGGGAGRSLAASSGVRRPNARVELYNASGNFISATTTDASGNYTFAGLDAGSYTVRVVNSSVTSSRPGYVPGLLPVQTFRTNGLTGSVGAADPNRVGGEAPSLVDAGDGSTTLAALTTVSTTAQSITSVTLGVSNITGIDFGYNFSTIVNTNGSGQGSLRRFIINSNGLGGEASLAQSGSRQLAGVNQALPAGKETSIFMITGGSAVPGLRVLPTQLTSGVALIVPVTPLDTITGANTIIDGTTQTVNIGNTNAAVLGSGGTVGVDGLTVPQVRGPGVEIRSTTSVVNGLTWIQPPAAPSGI